VRRGTEKAKGHFSLFHSCVCGGQKILVLARVDEVDPVSAAFARERRLDAHLALPLQSLESARRRLIPLRFEPAQVEVLPVCLAAHARQQDAIGQMQFVDLATQGLKAPHFQKNPGSPETRPDQSPVVQEARADLAHNSDWCGRRLVQTVQPPKLRLARE
jgi:hypothetical protein